MSGEGQAGALAEKPAEGLPTAGSAVGAPAITADIAKQIILAEQQARIDRAAEKINAILKAEGLELRVKQVVQLGVI